MMLKSKFVFIIICVLLLPGCSLLRYLVGPEPVQIPQSNSAASSEKAFKLTILDPNQSATSLTSEKTFKLTLMGGNALNAKSDGVPRPVQVCVYVVRTREWVVPLSRDQSTCLDRSSDVNVMYSRRVVLAPMQINQLSLPFVTGQESWLFIDADYSQRAAQQSQQSFLISSRSNQLHALLNGNELFVYDNASLKRSTAPSELSANVREAPVQHRVAKNPVVSIAETLPTTPSSAPGQSLVSGELERLAPTRIRAVVNPVTTPSTFTIERQGQGVFRDEVGRSLDGRR